MPRLTQTQLSKIDLVYPNQIAGGPPANRTQPTVGFGDQPAYPERDPFSTDLSHCLLFFLCIFLIVLPIVLVFAFFDSVRHLPFSKMCATVMRHSRIVLTGIPLSRGQECLECPLVIAIAVTSGAGRENRTLVTSLEGWSFATKLYPRA